MRRIRWKGYPRGLERVRHRAMVPVEQICEKELTAATWTPLGKKNPEEVLSRCAGAWWKRNRDLARPCLGIGFGKTTSRVDVLVSPAAATLVPDPGIGARKHPEAKNMPRRMSSSVHSAGIQKVAVKLKVNVVPLFRPKTKKVTNDKVYTHKSSG
jgi:hypothetical protein